MNVESYSYVLVTAVVGMGVVFFFLVFLSVMMHVIRRIFDTPAPGVKAGRTAARSGGTEETETGGDSVDSHGIPHWVVAGALAYILVEEQEYTPHAGIWTQRGQT